MSKQHYFGAVGETVLNPFALVLVLLAVVLTLLLPRKYVFVPVLVVAVIMPLQQQVVIAGLHFMVVRILILAGWVRIAFALATGARRERIQFNALDRVFV